MPRKANVLLDVLSRRPDLAVVVVKWDESDGIFQCIREAQKAASLDAEWQKHVEYME